MPTQNVGTDVDDLCQGPSGASKSAVSEKRSHLREAIVSRFYEEGRAAGLTEVQLDQLLEDVRQAGRDGRARKLTPVGVDRRIVRKVLEAADLIPVLA